jgi:threonyl-tRNA synthetase
MNCPFHCLIYKNRPKSFRDLPVRWAELGTVYRYERSGALHGLFRVRGFTQDDAHIFCLPGKFFVNTIRVFTYLLTEQLEDEIVGVLDLVENVLKRFGFKNIEVMLSTRPAESVGSDAIWSSATKALVNALNRKGKGWGDGYYTEDIGGGAFYGPKIDVKIRDGLGRLWQCSTIQCDFNLPERFQLEYTTSSSVKERPIMVHRAIFGSIERFFGVLIENTAGSFPLWLAPVQVKILPVSNINDAIMAKCSDILNKYKSIGIRAEVDLSNERVSKLIRNSEMEKVPLAIVVGQNEVNTGKLSVRVRKHGLLPNPVDGDALLNVIDQGIKHCLEDDAIAAALKNVVS